MRRKFSGLSDVEAAESCPIEDHIAGRTLSEILSASAKKYSHKTAYRFCETADPNEASVDLSYAEIYRLTCQAAELFSSLGVGRKDPVAFLLPGLPSTLPLQWGAAAAGIAFPINPFLEPAAIAGMLMRTNTKILCLEGPKGQDGVWEKLEAVRSAAPCLERIFVAGEEMDVGDAVCVESALAEFSGKPLPPVNPDDIAAYFHTGGTTGAPKIAPLSHYNLACMSWIAAYGGGLREDDVVPCGMPLFHVGALVMGAMAPFSVGATIIQLSRQGYRNPGIMNGLWPLFASMGVTINVGPPTVVLAATERFQPSDTIGNIRSWISSASALPKEVHHRFTEKTGIPIKEAWGLTEATLVLTFTPSDGVSKPGSVGVRMPYVDLKAVELDGQGNVLKECETGEAGNIIALSPCNFEGYLDPAANKDAFTGDGWLITGDLGHFDEDGYLTITGRSKDLIIRGGHNIDPSVIEEPVNAHKDVAIAAAVGKPDKRVGEVPVVFVSLLEGAQIDPDALLLDIRGKITERAAIPKEVIILDSLPLTNVGKINKQALRLEAICRAAADVLGCSFGEIDAEIRTDGQTNVWLSKELSTEALSAGKAELMELNLTLVEHGSQGKKAIKQ